MITSPYNCICIIFSTERIKSLPFSRADQKLFSYWQSSCVNHMSSDTINTHSRTTMWLSFQTGNLKNAFHSILAMIKKKIWYLCNHTHCILLLVLRKGELSFWLHLILQWESPLPQSIVYWMIDYLKQFPHTEFWPHVFQILFLLHSPCSSGARQSRMWSERGTSHGPVSSERMLSGSAW